MTQYFKTSRFHWVWQKIKNAYFSQHIITKGHKKLVQWIHWVWHDIKTCKHHKAHHQRTSDTTSKQLDCSQGTWQNRMASLNIIALSSIKNIKNNGISRICWWFVYFRHKYLKSVSLLFDIWVRVETHQSSLAEEGCEKVSEPVEQTLD